MQDLIDQLDAELRSGPAAAFDVAVTVRAGRRAVRRRRLAAGASGLAAAVLIGGFAAISGGSTEHASDVPVAGDPSASVSPEPWPDEDLHYEPLRSTDQGWQVNPRATILEQIEFTATDRHVYTAFRLRFEGDQLYAVGRDDGTWVADEIRARNRPPLRAWAEKQFKMAGDR